MSGRVIFTSAGHGWTFSNGSTAAQKWFTQRGDNNEVVEDYGNLDQMTMFAAYCFNAGATVVPLRPVGYQTNEVIVDNTDPGVSYSGAWADSGATSDYFGKPGEIGYRFASIASTETATATYTPLIPATGFYPVYAWARSGGNRTVQLYRVRHTGGQADVRVPHHMVGDGWIYLGTYYFNAGSNRVSGSVVISNLRPDPTVGSVVIADAVRFGNGMGDVIPISTAGPAGTISGYPREEEASRYWVQRSLGVGAPESIYDTDSTDSNDNVGAPPRMAKHMNREAAGSMFNRVYLGFHSNASGSANPTARGCVGLYNNESLFPGTATPNQFRLAQLVAVELNQDMAAQTVPPLEVPWQSRSLSSLTFARTDFAFGEINNTQIGDEFDATIVETAFHDQPDDARLLRDPKARNIMARACYQGLVRYMNQFDGAPLVFLPEPPRHLWAMADLAEGIVVGWDTPGSGGGNPAGYRVYRSTDGYGFGQPQEVPGGSTTFVRLLDLPDDTDLYFRVAAVNEGGESMPSETVGCRRSSHGDQPVLVVNGFDRFDRPLAVRQTAGPGIGGTAGGVQTFDRVKPRLMNSFDYVVPHGRALSHSGVAFDSCDNEVLLQATIRLEWYRSVFWILGQESTLDETFSAEEQALVNSFLQAGGNLFVSGSEIGWDLDRDAGPTAADRAFLNTRLHVDLGGNQNDSAGTYLFAPRPGSLFEGQPAAWFDDGTAGVYDVRFPDVLNPVGGGTRVALDYVGGLSGPAAVQFQDPLNQGRVVILGFPFEAIVSPAVRAGYLGAVLEFFGDLPVPRIVEMAGPGDGQQVILTWTAVPGLSYRVQSKRALTDPAWADLPGDVRASGPTASKTDASLAGVRQKFYRVVLLR